MKRAPLEPLPTPLPQRLQDLRLRLLPFLTLLGCVVAIALLWSSNVGTPRMVGQAEPVTVSVSIPKSGTIAELRVGRFQVVRVGDVLGHVFIASPAEMEASLAVVQAELEALRCGMQPIAFQQRNAMDYARLKIDWMRQRAELASARVNLQLAESEFRRSDGLHNEKLLSDSEWDNTRANRDALRRQVDELTKLVDDGEISVIGMYPPGSTNMAQITDAPMRAAIAVHESKLRLVEAQLGPVALIAPMSGIVTAVHHRPGQSVAAGEPIIVIGSQSPVRIVGYVRSPDFDSVRPGMNVSVRRRNNHHSTGVARITEVGSQLESPPASFSGSPRLTTDLALPVEISLPENLQLRPGELVDVALIAAGK